MGKFFPRSRELLYTMTMLHFTLRCIYLFSRYEEGDYETGSDVSDLTGEGLSDDEDMEQDIEMGIHHHHHFHSDMDDEVNQFVLFLTLKSNGHYAFL